MAGEAARLPGNASQWPRSASIILILLTALLLLSRLWGLDYQAFHHDESIHSKAIWDLARQGPEAYRYNPVYHGPLFYHFAALFSAVLPDTDFTARLPFAVAGVILVLAAVPLARVVGVRAALLLMALLIISPTITYYSRFAREDVLMTALLAWTITGGAVYIQTRRLRWLMVAWLSIVLAYCNKENSYVNGFLVCAFVVAMGIWSIWRGGRAGLRTVVVTYAPLTRLLILFACFSISVFFFVAIDARVGPQTPLVEGFAQIARHSVALSPDAVDPAVFEESSGYFTADGREEVRARFYVMAVSATLLLLLLMEVLRSTLSGGGHGARWWAGIAALIGYGAAALWLSEFYRWAAHHDGHGFLGGLRAQLLAGGLLLSGLCLLPQVPTILSGRVRRRTGEGWRRWRVLIRLLRPGLVGHWVLAVQVLIAIGIYSFLFSSLGTNAPAGLRAGLYDYIAYWFRQQTGEFRIWGVWWYYLPRLALYETAALALAVLGGVWLLVSRRGKDRKAAGPFALFATWLSLGMIFVYALLNEKVGWLGMYQAYAITLLAALVGSVFLQHVHGWRWRLTVIGILPAAFLFTAWQHALSVHLFPDAPTEPMAYVTTSRDYLGEMRRIEAAHWYAVEAGDEPPLVALTGEGVWPGAWYLRRLRTTPDAQTPGVSIFLLDDNPDNRRRLEFMPEYRWEQRPVVVRGWWFAQAEGLPGRKSLTRNLYALLTNRRNDHSELFPEGSPHWDDYTTRFASQVFRFAIWRRPWYPPTGSTVLFAWRTDEPAAFDGEGPWLDGLEREPREAPVIVRFGDGGILDSPRALALLPDGDIAVADSGNGRIAIFNAEGTFQREVGAGILSSDVTGPCGLAADAEGRLYVADTWNHAIRLFSAEGELLATCDGLPLEGAAGRFYGPRGIAILGDFVYITDTGNNRVAVLNRNLEPVMLWGQAGVRPGEFNEPVGIVAAPDGSIYVADTGNGRIQRLDGQGSPLDEYAIYLPRGGERLAAEPQLALLPDGERLAMTYATRGLFVIIDPVTHQAWPWRPVGEAAEPSGIAFSTDWRLYMADRISSSIMILNDQTEEEALP